MFVLGERLRRTGVEQIVVKPLLDLGLALENQPVFVAVVKVAVEADIGSRDTEYAGTGYTALLRSIALSHGFYAGSDNRHLSTRTHKSFLVINEQPTSRAMWCSRAKFMA